VGQRGKLYAESLVNPHFVAFGVVERVFVAEFFNFASPHTQLLSK
jgi:hypothetical protein